MDADVATAPAYPDIDISPPSGITTLGAFASTVPTDPPPALVPDERERLRAAARKVEALYSGEVGRYLRIELESWASYGCFPVRR